MKRFPLMIMTGLLLAVPVPHACADGGARGATDRDGKETMVFYALGGWAATAQDDINSWLLDRSEARYGTRAADTFDDSWELLLGERRMVERWFSWGFEGAWQSRSEKNFDGRSDSPDSYKVHLRLITVEGVVAASLPFAPTLTCGVTSGVGFGKLVEEYVGPDDPHSPPNPDHPSPPGFTGTDWIAGAFLAYSRPFGESRVLLARTGYHYRHMGDFDGWGRSKTGKPFDFDFSGPFLQLGVAISYQ